MLSTQSQSDFITAVDHKNKQQYPMALEFLNKCLSQDPIDSGFVYECLLIKGLCLDALNANSVDVNIALLEAIETLPRRPEAYHLLARIKNWNHYYEEAYIHSLASHCCDHENLKPLRHYAFYTGKHCLWFEKALSAFHCKHLEESHELFLNLYKNSWYQLDAYQKKQTKHYLEKYFGLQFQKKSTFNYPENFNWAELSDDDISTIKREIVDEQAYRVFRDVQANDIVLDIGASVGAFTVSILDQKPRQVYCVEPSKNLIKALIENCADKLMANPISIAFINHGIVGESNEKIDIFGKDESYTTMTFAQLIENYAITWVDYLKIDCEGGEYSIFNKDNIEFLMKQVGFIAMEMHLKCSNGRQKFIDFRNHYLSRFKNYTVLSCTTQNIAYGTVVDLTQKIQDDTFVNNYQCEFMIYIDNNTQ